ncbi:unnamed protein product [Choristocarpus tenellus]
MVLLMRGQDYLRMMVGSGAYPPSLPLFEPWSWPSPCNPLTSVHLICVLMNKARANAGRRRHTHGNGGEWWTSR